MVYWHVRPSPHLPTVEVRVATRARSRAATTASALLVAPSSAARWTRCAPVNPAPAVPRPAAAGGVLAGRPARDARHPARDPHPMTAPPTSVGRLVEELWSVSSRTSAATATTGGSAELAEREVQRQVPRLRARQRRVADQHGAVSRPSSTNSAVVPVTRAEARARPRPSQGCRGRTGAPGPVVRFRPAVRCGAAGPGRGRGRCARLRGSPPWGRGDRRRRTGEGGARCRDAGRIRTTGALGRGSAGRVGGGQTLPDQCGRRLCRAQVPGRPRWSGRSVTVVLDGVDAGARLLGGEAVDLDADGVDDPAPRSPRSPAPRGRRAGATGRRHRAWRAGCWPARRRRRTGAAVSRFCRVRQEPRAAGTTMSTGAARISSGATQSWRPARGRSSACPGRRRSPSARRPRP